jgi:hypothetical protein
VSNVKSIFGGPVGVPEPNDTCIEAIRKLLEMAESGEVVGIAVAALDKDGCGRWELAGRVGGYSMLGALEIARAELVDVNRGFE